MSDAARPPCGRLAAGRQNVLAVLAVTWLAGCAAAPTAGPAAVPAAMPAAMPAAPTAVRAPLAAAAEALAPTGTLRIGVYLGSPSSLVRGADGQARGVSVELGQALARQLGVPARLVEFARLALVLDALKAGEVDFTVTNASPARAREMRFSAPLLALELGHLVLPGGRVTTLADVDRPGVKVGVAQGSSSQAALARVLKAASVVSAPNLQAAAQMLQRGEIDSFATNKAILHEMADGLRGAIVLPGRWGEEHLAIAIPIAHDSGLETVQRFAEAARADGSVRRAAERAGLRGTLALP